MVLMNSLAADSLTTKSMKPCDCGKSYPVEPSDNFCGHCGKSVKRLAVSLSEGASSSFLLGDDSLVIYCDSSDVAASLLVQIPITIKNIGIQTVCMEGGSFKLQYLQDTETGV